MADERKYYVLCADNCKFESMTKEQILAAIEQAISTGEIKDVDSGFITRIKEINAGVGVKLWIGTQAKYNADVANGIDLSNALCIIIDDTSEEDIANALNESKKAVEAMQERVAAIQEILDSTPRTRVLYSGEKTNAASLNDIFDRVEYDFIIATIPSSNALQTQNTKIMLNYFYHDFDMLEDVYCATVGDVEYKVTLNVYASNQKSDSFTITGTRNGEGVWCSATKLVGYYTE